MQETIKLLSLQIGQLRQANSPPFPDSSAPAVDEDGLPLLDHELNAQTLLQSGMSPQALTAAGAVLEHPTPAGQY